ncbi:MAG TPA: type III polyketide synthase, partial [Chitinophagaceae bacterium]
MSKIISIGTAVPTHRHEQSRILQFMQQVYAMDETENRKLRFLYNRSGIDTRYSVIRDYSRPLHEWKFYPHSENLEPFPSLEQRMTWFNKYAAPLSVDAIRDCLDGQMQDHAITHLITVSCTGMSAPGLDLQVMELMDLPKNIYRTSVNFMGCYAAIHALKLADTICKTEVNARVMIVCTELCTLHFQRE